MLRIKKLRYKNILSTGNQWTEIDFESAKTILAYGTNGSGKSTVLSALVFNLYGKDFRGIKKGGLVNSINRKGLLTETEISVGGSEYKIVRGISKDIFEVYKDGQLMDMGIKKEQQKLLERKILGFPYKPFKQHVATGSGEYIPFMKLEAKDRREFIDEFLETNIFTQMRGVSKTMNDNLVDSLKDVKRKIESTEEKIKYVEKAKLQRTTENSSKIKEYTDTANNLSVEIEELNAQRIKLENGLVEFTDRMEKINIIEGHILTLDGQRSNLISRKRQLQHRIKDIQHIENCPTCLQLVNDSHKEKIKSQNDGEIANLDAEMEPIEAKVKRLSDAISKKSAVQKKISDINNAISLIDKSISAKNASVSMFNRQIADLNRPIEEIDDLDELINSRDELNKSLADLSEEQFILNYCNLMLRDDGVKSVIIKKYVDILNKLINGFLQKFDFYVNFEFDENFDETIKSRHRDEFTYQNFSEGEKARIDLSILFAFRTLAKAKSNLDCNLMIIDELLDSAMDSTGIDDLLTIFKIFDDLNIFVISHRERATEMFDRTLEFKKVGHFSQMEIKS